MGRVGLINESMVHVMDEVDLEEVFVWRVAFMKSGSVFMRVYLEAVFRMVLGRCREGV